mmetsp:Transcript_61796/g.201621  ORF Transcript_61796/g.201621 Transcript_61796/m.201621 type:complete len:285 (-) Transcript_61796:2360-3214(-)
MVRRSSKILDAIVLGLPAELLLHIEVGLPGLLHPRPLPLHDILQTRVVVVEQQLLQRRPGQLAPEQPHQGDGVRGRPLPAAILAHHDDHDATLAQGRAVVLISDLAEVQAVVREPQEAKGVALRWRRPPLERKREDPRPSLLFDLLVVGDHQQGARGLPVADVLPLLAEGLGVRVVEATLARSRGEAVQERRATKAADEDVLDRAFQHLLGAVGDIAMPLLDGCCGIHFGVDALRLAIVARQGHTRALLLELRVHHRDDLQHAGGQQLLEGQDRRRARAARDDG